MKYRCDDIMYRKCSTIFLEEYVLNFNPLFAVTYVVRNRTGLYKAQIPLTLCYHQSISSIVFGSS